MQQRTRWMLTLAGAGLLATLAATAQARGSVSVGVQIGLHGPAIGGVHVGRGGGAYRHGGYGHRWGGHGWVGHGWGARQWGPAWVVLAPPLVYSLAGPPVELVAQPAFVDAPAPVTPPRPDPVIYPRQDQTPQQTEADRQDCNRWATTLPAALADAGVFHRAVDACMDGRGYTLK